MSKRRKVIIGVISVIAGSILLIYLCLCLLSEKPGMNGFTVTNGMLNMLVTNKDYVKVGENRYLYRGGNLSNIIENEYDSIKFSEQWHPKYDDLAQLDESSVLKSGIVSKNGLELKGGGHSVWTLPGWLLRLCDRNGIRLEEFYSVYYKPYIAN